MMKLLSVNLNDNVYNISADDEQPNHNTFSIVIGKNGTGKSRLLAKVATTFLSINKYHQNHYRQHMVKREYFCGKPIYSKRTAPLYQRSGCGAA